ncbi:uncharacterized protein LOC128550311 [Mercenaria mercenaria]|uniref:uncharacterized protein LOC128550311 n=1 Tax=Mercenaria mercenaria TaxID=6596 RepID=UPI00234F5604|nr:uncharacterized protein LOC128550311 [Mercenaria mercenaria]
MQEKRSSTKPTSPDQIIEDLGGCGRFQVFMGITVHLTKTLISFSVMSTIMLTATPPKWWCANDKVKFNKTSCSVDANATCPEKTCFMNDTKCETFEFAGVRTLVSEFSLLCDLDYIPSTVMSLQASGMLVGSLIAG